MLVGLLGAVGSANRSRGAGSRTSSSSLGNSVICGMHILSADTGATDTLDIPVALPSSFLPRVVPLGRSRYNNVYGKSRDVRDAYHFSGKNGVEPSPPRKHGNCRANGCPIVTNGGVCMGLPVSTHRATRTGLRHRVAISRYVGNVVLGHMSLCFPHRL
jgi:hypothetical protein